MDSTLLKKVFMIMFCLLVMLQVKTYAQTDIQAGIAHYRTADLPKAKECFERVSRKDKNITTRQKAYVYLALIASADNNIPKIDQYINALLLLNSSFNLNGIEDVTPIIKERFDILSEKFEIKKQLELKIKEKNKIEEKYKTLLAQQKSKKSNETTRRYKEIIEISNKEIENKGTIQSFWDNIDKYHQQYSSLLYDKKKGVKVPNDEIIPPLKNIIEYTQKLIEHYEQSSEKDEVTIKRLKIFLAIKQKAYYMLTN